jgi:hypothetical protein
MFPALSRVKARVVLLSKRYQLPGRAFIAAPMKGRADDQAVKKVTYRPGAAAAGPRWETRKMKKRRPATLIEVAERAGVSLTTASKAINGKTRVSEETRARVMAAARELSFTPNPIARGLTTGRTSTVGFIIADSMSHRFP